jgi:hypothetical protein
MNITAETKHDLLGFGPILRNDARGGLPHVEVVGVLGHAVHIVKKRVVILDLERLADSHPENARRIDAATLIKDNWLAGDRRLRKRSLQFHEDVL